MSDETPKELLRRHGLRVTPVRLAITKWLGRDALARSQGEIEEQLDGADRVTVYRALRDLEKAGVIHSLSDSAGVRKFALCHAECAAGNHEDNHAHFSCTRCAETYCLHRVAVPLIRSPRGFTVSHSALLMTGVCRSCAG